MIYRRIQYVVGYSEPKHVYSLTPSGHRKALEYRRKTVGAIDSAAHPPPPEPERQLERSRPRAERLSTHGRP